MNKKGGPQDTIPHQGENAVETAEQHRNDGVVPLYPKDGPSQGRSYVVRAEGDEEDQVSRQEKPSKKVKRTEYNNV